MCDLHTGILSHSSNKIEQNWSDTRLTWTSFDEQEITLVHSLANDFKQLKWHELFSQVYFNYTRKSTDGWSISNILLDLTGGVCNFGQMLTQSLDQSKHSASLILAFIYEKVYFIWSKLVIWKKISFIRESFCSRLTTSHDSSNSAIPYMPCFNLIFGHSLHDINPLHVQIPVACRFFCELFRKRRQSGSISGEWLVLINLLYTLVRTYD